MENEIQTLTFNMLPMTIGVLPSSYVDSMSYYETLIWLCNYLENTVIPTVNNNGEAVEELQSAYLTLHDYVEHYFDNLDVQEEINNKLDQMTEDGTLTNLIKAYVDPIYQAYESEINTTVNTALSTINEQMSVIGSGSPKGVYATLSDLETADPNHNYTYVVTANGKWYYYANSQWNEGGTYQSTGIADGTITGDKTNFVNDSLNKIKIADGEYEAYGVTATVTNGVVVLDGTATATNYLNIPITNTKALSGQFIVTLFSNDNSDFEYRLNTNIKTGGGTYKFDTNRAYLLDNETLTYFAIRLNNGSTLDNVTVKPMLVEWDKYNIFESGFKAFNNSVKYTSNIYDIVPDNTISYNKTDFVTVGKNLINPDKLISGYGTSVNQKTKELTINESPSYTTFIGYCKDTTTITFYPRIRLYGTWINGVYNNYDQEVSGARTLTFNAGTRYSVAFYKSDLPNIMAVVGSSAGDFEPYRYIINHLDTGNILYNKNYVALGDSFTHGAFQDSQTNNYTIESGKYKDQYKVYPFLIGNRNEMNVTNLAVNGMSLATYTGGTNVLSKDGGVYTTIPANADYITIKIGINDFNNDVPIGNITDSTNTTFYGAWNKVLPYIIEHHPNAKIGIIVSNGLQHHPEYGVATIAICEKYGIPYLNEDTDPNVPLLIRTNKTDVLQSVRDLRDSTWEVNPTAENYHPNELCHEYESTIVENFLRSL